MRTTLSIDDDVLQAAQALAEVQRRRLGEVISELARKGLAPKPDRILDSNLPVFQVPPDAPPITPEMVTAALYDDERFGVRSPAGGGDSLNDPSA